MRTFSFICSILLHISIIILAIYIPKTSHKINLREQHIYNVQIITLKPKKRSRNKRILTKKRVYKKPVIIKRFNPHGEIANKKVVKIPIRTTKKVKHKIPVKINPEILKQKILKSAISEIESSIEKQRQQNSFIQKEIKSLEKKAKTENSSETSNNNIKIYSKFVEQKIKENWRYQLLKSSKLNTVVQITINKHGDIDFKIKKPSGNPSFDNAVIKAILETKKLPPPPIGGKKITIYITFFGQGRQ